MGRARDIAALLAYLEARSATPFAWGRGRNDCVSFAAGAVKALAGDEQLDHGLGALGWSSEKDAKALLARLGGLEAAVDARFRRIAPAAAQRGDLAGVPDAELGIRLMIVEGDMLVGPGTRGLRRVARGAMAAAWCACDG